jgi:predicted Fe-Mo cluster-binding NifX family protein
MKIAVTSKGKDLNSEVDPRFGRASYILIIDTETLEFEAVDNSDNVNAFKGAGIQAASMISNKKADVLLTGFCGPKAFEVLKAAKIKVADNISGIVKDVVLKFNKSEVKFTDSPNVEQHW